MTKNNFSTNFYEEIGVGLTTFGFERKSKGIYVAKISSDTLGWIGLNVCRSTDDDLELYPIIGVINLKINKLINSLLKFKSTGMFPTLSEPLSYLTPRHEYRTWTWAAKKEYDTTSEFLSTISQYGLPFIELYASTEYLYKTLREASEKHEAPPFTVNCEQVLPVLMYLMNEKHLIHQYIARTRQELAPQNEPNDFDSFAEKLLNFIEIH